MRHKGHIPTQGTTAIPTESPKDLQTFISMVNYLGKFVPHLGDQRDKQINSASHTMKMQKLAMGRSPAEIS